MSLIGTPFGEISGTTHRFLAMVPISVEFGCLAPTKDAGSAVGDRVIAKVDPWIARPEGEIELCGQNFVARGDGATFPNCQNRIAGRRQLFIDGDEAGGELMVGGAAGCVCRHAFSLLILINQEGSRMTGHSAFGVTFGRSMAIALPASVSVIPRDWPA